MPHELWGFMLWLLETGGGSRRVRAPSIIPPVLSGGSFPSFRSFLPCVYWSVFSQRLKGDLLRISRALCPGSSLHSNALPCKFWPWPPRTFSSIFSTQGHCCVLWVLLACTSPWKLSPGNCRIHLMSFPYLRDHCPSWHDVQCLKKRPDLACSYMLPDLLTVKERKVNLVLITIPWPEADVLTLRFEAKQSSFKTWDHRC